MEEKNKVNHYYISLPFQKTEADLIDFEIKMLEQNRIRGLLPAAREYQDTEVKIYFDISGRQNLEQRYAWQKLTGQELKQILRSITAVAAELEEYMLDYNHLNLMPEYMYGMLDPGDLCFCYEPWDSETFGERLKPLALWFLDHMDYHEREEVIFSYEFQRFCDENDVSPALLEQFMAGKAAAGSSYIRKGAGILWESRREAVEMQEQARPDADTARRESGAEIGDDSVWEEGYGETAEKKNGGMKELLRRIFPTGGKRYPDFSSVESLQFAEEETEYGRLTTERRKKESLQADEAPGKAEEQKFPDSSARPDEATEETAAEETVQDAVLAELTSSKLPALHIRGYPCLLGSDEDFSDCTIADESVSRIHARIFLADGRVWAEDLHSESGTFINGDRMTPDEPWVLKDGDELRIGKCPYHFFQKNRGKEPRRPGKKQKKSVIRD